MESGGNFPICTSPCRLQGHCPTETESKGPEPVRIDVRKGSDLLPSQHGKPLAPYSVLEESTILGCGVNHVVKIVLIVSSSEIVGQESDHSFSRIFSSIFSFKALTAVTCESSIHYDTRIEHRLVHIGWSD